jgi:hypothetical protein
MVKAMGKQDIYLIKQAKRAVVRERFQVPEWLKKWNERVCKECRY